MREVIKIINPYDPGLFPEDFEKPEVIQLGSNENPYEPSEEVKRAYIQSLKFIRLYPKSTYDILKTELSKYLGVERDEISVGCGASELINCVCMALLEELDKVAIPVPCYTLYAIYAMLRNAQIYYPHFTGYKLKSDFVYDVKPKLTFLCSPNNPTGNIIKRKVIEEILENSEYVVLDEAYVEFSSTSNVNLIEEFDNLIVIRSFSKFFGLAGMRVGYLVADRKIVEGIEKIRLPFAISYPALRTAVAALRSVDYYLNLKEKIVRERERVYEKLRKISGLEPYPSEANFILVKVTREVDDLIQKLLNEGIIVRDVTGLIGLDGKHFRVTIGKPEENDRLLVLLSKFC